MWLKLTDSTLFFFVDSVITVSRLLKSQLKSSQKTVDILFCLSSGIILKFFYSGFYCYYLSNYTTFQVKTQKNNF